MVFCGLYLKEVKRNTCIYCKEDGHPDNCNYKREGPKQIPLEAFDGQES